MRHRWPKAAPIVGGLLLSLFLLAWIVLPILGNWGRQDADGLWDLSRYDRDAALERLASPHESDHLVAIVALSYKSYDLRQAEVDALLEFACRHGVLDDSRDQGVRRLLIAGAVRSESAILHRLRQMTRGEAPATTTFGAQRMIDVLTTIDPDYADAFEATQVDDGVSRNIAVHLEALDRVFQGRH